MSDNTESREEIEEREGPIMTINEVIEEEEQLEAVLGGSDEKECTYEKGYIKRQALYSCLTCCPDGRTDETKAAGICLACTYQCHENHELIELYTKRNFRCDCPTIRVPQNKCTFAKNNNECSSSSGSSSNNKYPENKDNMYNQNFTGNYCICKRPYPDPEDEIQDEMIQCGICEDWYHTRHLNVPSIPKSDMYREMTCNICVQKYDFLKDYCGYAINKVEEEEMCTENENIDINTVTCVDGGGDDDKLKSELDKSISDIMSISKTNNDEIGSSSNIEGDDNVPPSKKMKLNDEQKEICKRPAGKCYYKNESLFWTDEWRENLCKCSECIKMYSIHKVEFLLDKEDTVQFYEANGIKKSNEAIINALSSLDHVAQIEAITHYNRLKDKLREFLRPFVTSQKIVTEAAVREFFQEMKNEKKTTIGVPPRFCR